MKPLTQRKGQTVTARAPQTREPISQRERTALMLLMVVAVGMRFARSAARISIEHWDEAVYAINRFFPDGSYPGRYLYAPPLLPALIELTMLVAGPTSYAAVLPNLIFSTLTVALCWWAAREWFGRSAGLAAAALVALSDFHIAYSRTALTDPALCFWFLLAVYCTWRALTRNHLGEAVVAGVAAGRLGRRNTTAGSLWRSPPRRSSPGLVSSGSTVASGWPGCRSWVPSSWLQPSAGARSGSACAPVNTRR